MVLPSNDDSQGEKPRVMIDQTGILTVCILFISVSCLYWCVLAESEFEIAGKMSARKVQMEFEVFGKVQGIHKI